MKLYNHRRSLASFRVRTALAFKNVLHGYLPVHLARGEHQQPGHSAITADGSPRTLTVFDACMALPALQVAQSSVCPDAQA